MHVVYSDVFYGFVSFSDVDVTCSSLILFLFNYPTHITITGTVDGDELDFSLKINTREPLEIRIS